MSIWIKRNSKTIIGEKQKYNIFVKYQESIAEEVKRASSAFVDWIEKEYIFPSKLVIVFLPERLFAANDGDMVSATCFLPYDKDEIPYIKIATGDYVEFINQSEKDDILAGILHSIAHELTHYFQWLKCMDSYDEKMEKQAVRCADYIIRKYAQTRQHP